MREIRTGRGRVSVEYTKALPWDILRCLALDLLPEGHADLVEVLKIVRSRDTEGLLRLSQNWNLQSISDDDCGAIRYLLGSIIRKYPFEGDVTVRRQTAIDKLLQAEISCSLFNRSGWKGLYVDGHPSQPLLDMQEFVLRVIGFEPDDECYTDARHGPGADTNSHGLTSKYDKYLDWPYHVTGPASGYARKLIELDERWLGALEDSYRERFSIAKWEILDREEFWKRVLLIRDQNRITTVPKDGLTDRPIAIEPRINLMLQLGVDGVIRRRLKRWGINLDSQYRNQELAREGSIREDADTPTTLDLSNASDTVSLRVVKLLFPDPWYRYLVALRSPKGVLPGGRRLRYSKLSSMGNGATFALETLVFAAVVYAASKYTYGRWDRDGIAIYGDDIVVPQAMSAYTITLLEACGFELNLRKSFTSGDRRESCGTDWVHGTDVRPIFIKKKPECSADIFVILNGLHRWSSLRYLEIPCTEAYLLRLIPPSHRCYGPLSDTCFDAWIHTCDMSHGRYHGERPWSFEFSALRCLPRTRGGNEFLFRKLMATLRPVSMEDSHAQAHMQVLHVKQGGSVFDIVQPNRGKLRVSKTWMPYWQSVYHPSFQFLDRRGSSRACVVTDSDAHTQPELAARESAPQ